MNINNLDIRYVDGSSDINTLFIGDSLIEQYYPKAKTLSKNGLGNVWFLTESGCMPLIGVFKKNWPCTNGEYLHQLLRTNKFDNIMVGGYWQKYLSDKSPFFLKEKEIVYTFTSKDGQEIMSSKIEDFFTLLLTETNNIKFILPTLMGSMFNPKEIIKKVIDNDKSYLKGYEKKSFYKENTEFYSFMNDVSQKFNIKLIDPIKSLCPTKKCYVIDENGVPFYKDSIHLRPAYVINNANFLDNTAN